MSLKFPWISKSDAEVSFMDGASILRMRRPFLSNERKMIGTLNSFDTLKTDADVILIDADVYFKVKLGRRIPVRLHLGG